MVASITDNVTGNNIRNEVLPIDFRLAQKFGFASCERKVGAAEGVNVLVEKNTKSGWEYSVTCIEYTEFNKLGIPDVPVSPGRYMLLNTLNKELDESLVL